MWVFFLRLILRFSLYHWFWAVWLWCPWCFWGSRRSLWVYSFHQIFKIFSHLFLQIFSLFACHLLGTPISPLLGCLKLSHSSLMLCLLFLFILDSLYCYKDIFNAQIFSSRILNFLLIFFILHIVFISRSTLSMCLLIFLNIWNSYKWFNVFVTSTMRVSFD